MADPMPRDVSGDPYAIPANRIGDPSADTDLTQATAAYWDHPARREIKRLIDLGDANAILDELQNRNTEWDDAREALDNLVRAADIRAAALGEALTAAEASNVPTVERLAEILWTARKRALGDSDDDQPFADASPRLRTQYMREAAAVAELLRQDGGGRG